MNGAKQHTKVQLFTPKGEYVTTVSIQPVSHPKAILWGQRMFIMEAGRFVEAALWVCNDKPVSIEEAG